MTLQKLKKKANISDEIIGNTLFIGSHFFNDNFNICKYPDLGFTVFQEPLKKKYYYFKGRITNKAIRYISKSRQELNSSISLIVKNSVQPSRFFLTDEIYTISEQACMQIKLVQKMVIVKFPPTIKIIALNKQNIVEWLPAMEKTEYAHLNIDKVYAYLNAFDSTASLAIYNESIVSILMQRRNEDTMIIEWMWTTPALRRKRLSTLLVATSLQDAYQRGLLRCFVQVPSALFKLFERMDFSLDETLTFYEFKGHPVKARHLAISFPYCGTLKSKEDYLNCIEELSAQSLPLHPDAPKNWDSLTALNIVIKTFDRQLKNINILDAGGELYSSILPQLEACGAKNLFCINLAFSSKKSVGNIIYEHGDITQTTFRDGHFDAIVCMSVVEHGVTHNKYFREMSRILKPGGILFTSTDFWPDTIQTPDNLSYGKPIKIYEKKSVQRLVNKSKKWGFKLMGELDLTARDYVVHCDGISYTFLYFTLQKI